MQPELKKSDSPSLLPVQILPATEHASLENRSYQGIPSIEQSPAGRLFAVWFAGGNGEGRDNYVMVFISDDAGITWSPDAVAVVDPPHPEVRAFDPQIWLAPNGKLYLFWCQVHSCPKDRTSSIWDGIAGVWFSILTNPDADPKDFHFTDPARIADGVMINKPTVLRDGTWALPASLWSFPPRDNNANLPEPGVMMVVSSDQGESFQVRGKIDTREIISGASCDEPIFIEFIDNLSCYIRTKQGIAVSQSFDQGLTWEQAELRQDMSKIESRFFIRRLRSGRLLLVSNQHPNQRKNLTAALSEDNGKSWPYQLLLDAGDEIGDVSYPDGFQAADGSIFIIYDCARYNGGYLFLARFSEAEIIAGKLLEERSFLQHQINRSRPIEQQEENN